jgi:hypothetical protein
MNATGYARDEIRGAADSLRVLLTAVREGHIEASQNQHGALAGMVTALDLAAAPDPPTG